MGRQERDPDHCQSASADAAEHSLLDRAGGRGDQDVQLLLQRQCPGRRGGGVCGGEQGHDRVGQLCFGKPVHLANQGNRDHSQLVCSFLGGRLPWWFVYGGFLHAHDSEGSRPGPQDAELQRKGRRLCCALLCPKEVARNAAVWFALQEVRNRGACGGELPGVANASHAHAVREDLHALRHSQPHDPLPHPHLLRDRQLGRRVRRTALGAPTACRLGPSGRAGSGLPGHAAGQLRRRRRARRHPRGLCRQFACGC
mmetsp:Transcript_1664/g.3887  ORF Transcript_1664/g.3887 Transcript_1664/m.3887 type:complete len:255 (+) Transcript_1664:378-1142(+)